MNLCTITKTDLENVELFKTGSSFNQAQSNNLVLPLFPIYICPGTFFYPLLLT